MAVEFDVFVVGVGNEDQLQKAGMQIIKLDPQALTELPKTAKMLYPEFGEVVGKENLDLFENM